MVMECGAAVSSHRLVMDSDGIEEGMNIGTDIIVWNSNMSTVGFCFNFLYISIWQNASGGEQAYRRGQGKDDAPQWTARVFDKIRWYIFYLTLK